MPERDLQKRRVQKQIVVFALFAWVATITVSVLYPLDRPVDELTKLSFLWAYAWVAAQAFVPVVGLVLPLLWLARLSPRATWPMSVFGLSVIPLVVLLDCITFHWIGERFLSKTLFYITVSLLPGLLPFVRWVTLALMIGCAIGAVVAVFALAQVSRRLAQRWSVEREGDLQPLTVVVLVTVLCLLVSLPALFQLDRTLAEMRDHSIRHPLCAFCLVGHRGTGVSIPEGEAAIMPELHGLGLYESVINRIASFQTAKLAESSRPTDAPLQDVVVVIIESLQHDLLSAEVMPNTYALGQRGMLMGNHFSGGNASNLGIFSLLNGVESSYFPRSGEFPPLMNHLLHQAGYEIAFYGGSEGWDDFGMDTFIKPSHFDDFVIEPVDWLASDRRAIDRALRFLNRPDNVDGEPTPRCAVVYLYSSHRPFASLPDQEVFQPAATEKYVAPYTESQKQKIWNRYRNSVRSVDHLIAPLLSTERTVVVVGDHGESFMDDGTIGHGLRLSQIQNRTPAMVYVPGQTPRRIQEPTVHADILPTLLHGLGLDVRGSGIENEGLFEGVNLAATTDSVLATRRFATFHYMWPEALLVGPWTADPDRPFGYRIAFSTDKWQVAPLNPVDARGFEWHADSEQSNQVEEQLDGWLVERFGINPTREDATEKALFRRYLQSDVPEVRLRAIEIAELVPEPSAELLELLSDCVSDPAPEVRRRASEVVIKMQKLVHQ